MMDKLGFSMNKVSDPRLITRNISDDSIVTKLVDYSDVYHCEGGENNEVVDCFECSSTRSSTEEDVTVLCL
jgi:hypothetical protein